MGTSSKLFRRESEQVRGFAQELKDLLEATQSFVLQAKQTITPMAIMGLPPMGVIHTPMPSPSLLNLVALVKQEEDEGSA